MRRRNAFTLLEVLLAMTIAVMVLAAVYTFVGYQLTQAQAGREVIEKATLARSILGRIDTDVRATIALGDPGRYRLAPDVSGDTAANSPTASGTSAGTTGASSPSAASAPSTASSPSSSSSPSGSSTDPGSSSSSGQTGSVELPFGVVGSSTELNLFVSRFPGEAFNNATGESGQVTSDIRRISYWLGGDGGLCRMEVRLAISDPALDFTLPTSDVDQYLYAGEVKSLEISYYDGTAWQDSWDSTTLGPDNKTPIGSPRAIAIKIGIQPQGAALFGSNEPQTKVYRHVISIPTANGTPLNNNAEGGTTAP